jgi:hypothetical protein
MTDYIAMRDARKALAASALLVTCEAIAASGYLPGRQEMELRRLIADVRCAFGPDLPERETASNVIPIGAHAERAAQRILDAIAAEMQK